jgi:hypothetical protein
MSPDGGNAFRNSGQRIVSEVKRQSDEIRSVAERAVNRKTHACDQAIYAQAKAKLQNWTLGTPAYLSHIESEAHIKFDSALPLELSKIRIGLRGYLADSIEPICGSIAGRPGLAEEKESVILEN